LISAFDCDVEIFSPFFAFEFFDFIIATERTDYQLLEQSPVKIIFQFFRNLVVEIRKSGEIFLVSYLIFDITLNGSEKLLVFFYDLFFFWLFSKLFDKCLEIKQHLFHLPSKNVMFISAYIRKYGYISRE